MSQADASRTAYPPRIDFVFFDFDGVLVDSLDVKGKAFGDLFEEYGPDVVAQVVRYHEQHGGVSRFMKLRYFMEDLLGRSPTDAQLAELADRFSRLVKRRVAESSAIPGSREFLDRCQRSGAVSLVVSATPTAELVEIVDERGLARFFSAVVGSPTSKTDNIRILMDQWSVDAGRSVFIGDSRSDQEAAVSCGIPFVALETSGGVSFHDSEGLLRVRDFHGLPSWFRVGREAEGAAAGPPKGASS